MSGVSGAEVLIVIPDLRRPGIAAQKIAAEAKQAGFAVEVYCWGWGRRPDGSVEIDFRGRLTSPPDVVGRMP